MKRILLLLLLAVATSAGAITREDLQLLDTELSRKSGYDMQHQLRVQDIRQSALPQRDQYTLLVQEFRSFCYDSALIYVGLLLDEAVRLEDTHLYNKALLERAFIYLSAGLFKESDDVFSSMNPDQLAPAERIDYYVNRARLYYDMADYTQGALSKTYLQEGYLMSEAAIGLISVQDTVLYWSTAALYGMKLRDPNCAISRFQKALECSTITEHEQAIVYSSMAGIYDDLGEKTLSEHYWVLAAVADLRSSTKEAVAMSIVSQILFHEPGNHSTEWAARCIRSALDDALQYNARHRQLSISHILPIIEQQQLDEVRTKNRRITSLSILLYTLIAALLVLLVWLISRVRALAQAKQVNAAINAELEEANRIKKEYIATFLCGQTDLLSKLEKYQRTAKEAHMQRDEFYRQLDEMILRLFPHFIDNFNALLRDDAQLQPKKNELLSTELRIFALIRLGITDNEQIARVLDCSVNTVYTYKTRTKNRSDLSNDEFYQRVAQL